MAHGLIAAGGTGVVFTATMPMHPAVVAGEWGPRGPYNQLFILGSFVVLTKINCFVSD
jgi:hypothetical protein